MKAPTKWLRKSLVDLMTRWYHVLVSTWLCWCFYFVPGYPEGDTLVCQGCFRSWFSPVHWPPPRHTLHPMESSICQHYYFMCNIIITQYYGIDLCYLTDRIAGILLQGASRWTVDIGVRILNLWTSRFWDRSDNLSTTLSWHIVPPVTT